jgi:hypothetical protein
MFTNVCTGEDPCSLPKRPRIEKRQFLGSWKTEYPWITYDHADGNMRCRYCMDSRKKNAFTNGCATFKKDLLSKHAVKVDHRAAIEAMACRSHMQQAISRAYCDQELAVIAALNTVYFMAKNNLPNDNFSDFCLCKAVRTLVISVFSVCVKGVS